MFLFLCLRNYQKKIGYYLIFLTNLMFLMLPLFLTNLVFPVNAKAQNGTISGYVFKYSNPTIGIEDAVVTAYDRMNNQRGSAITNSSGRYTITNLATGEENNYYKVCAVKPKVYVRECYQKPDNSNPNGCSGTDCGFYWYEKELRDPNEMLVDLYSRTSVTDINFHLVQGGSIAGEISGSIENITYQVVLEGDIQYKNSNPVFLQFHLSQSNDNFFNDPNLLIIPPGNYKLRADDALSERKYYCTVYYKGPNGQTETYNPQEAWVFPFYLDQANQYTANFSLKKGGFIWGEVKEKLGANSVALSDARVEVTENNYGLSYEDETGIYFDQNNTAYEGIFTFFGLPPGKWILQTDDVPLIEQGVNIYLPEYYDNVYFQDQATPIIISEEDIDDTNYQGTFIEVVLRHAPVIQGWVIKQDPDQCNPSQYDPEKILEGITVELIPDFKPARPELFRTTQTDPNGYIFQKSDKIIPGPYKIRAKDLSVQYFPTDYQTITVAAGGRYEVNFCMQEVTAGSGNGNISGHFFLNENPNLPLPQVSIGLHSTFGLPFKETNTNNNGEYFFNDVTPGEYILFTTEKPVELILELYKDVCILDPNKFVEGSKIIETQATFEAAATAIFLLPGENRTNIDFGLSSYNYTFRSGLNLFGYPGLPVEKYNRTDKFCTQLIEQGSAMHSFRGIDPDTDQWYVVTPSNIQNNPKQIHTGQGYIIYMTSQAGPIFYPPFKTIPPESYQLEPGKNFIAYPSSIHRPIKSSSELLTAFGTSKEVASVKSFDNTSGKWKSTIWLWNKPGAGDFPIVQGEGYIAEMKVFKEVKTEKPNI